MGSVGADKQLSFIGFNQIESASGLQCCNLQIRNMKMQKSQIQSRKNCHHMRGCLWKLFHGRWEASSSSIVPTPIGERSLLQGTEATGELNLDDVKKILEAPGSRSRNTCKLETLSSMSRNICLQAKLELVNYWDGLESLKCIIFVQHGPKGDRS